MLTLACAIMLTASSATAQDKIPVNSLDDLPRHTYTIPGTASELLASDEQFAALAFQVRADIKADLEKYDIRDASTLQGFYGVLMSLDMLDGRFDEALAYVPLMRDLEDKQAAKLMTGLVTESIAEAHAQAGGDDARYRQIFAALLFARVGALPWDIVGDSVEERLGGARIRTENLILGIVLNRIDPIVEQTGGELGADLARGLVGMRAMLEIHLPLRDEQIAVYQAVVDRNRVEKQDIWQARSVTLSAGRDLTPVVVAIWDSGIDADLFPGVLFINPDETLDGTDTDDNGFVDDVHGIAFDLHSHRISDLLHPLDDMDADVEIVAGHMKGFSDLQAAVNSKEAAEVMQFMGGIEPEQVRSFIEDFGLFGNYAHGTHVAGIAAEGNPFIRILTCRLTLSYKMLPETPTLSGAHTDAAATYDTIEYFAEHDTRIVNMSWGGNRQGIEAALEANGAGGTPEQRAELARKIFRIWRDALYDAMASAPDILFVTSAGNADSDVEFDEMIPSGFDLPNLLVVGAVDQAGDPTSFTSFGSTVDVYANGFEVESYIPGGTRMKLSGTSQASPNVVNLAAKMLAIDPTLTPTRIIELIEKGADRTEGDHPMLLINPKRTLKLVEDAPLTPRD